MKASLIKDTPDACASHSSGIARKIIIAATLLVAAFLLFFRLGHYSLWDDETMVALVAKGVLKTGDTSALIDYDNVVAYENGRLLHNLHDRSTPPLATYITAASFVLFGKNTWGARIPFALMGLATIALVLYWARKQSLAILALVALGMLCNVTLILLFRQCRYYAPSILFTTAIAYVYYNWRGGRKQLLLLSLLFAGLFAANYLNYVILLPCLLIDYIIWKRREHALNLKDWACLLLPQAIICAPLALIWNPLKTGQSTLMASNHLADKLRLLYWYFRDLNTCEFYSIAILVLALVIGIWKKKTWMVRGCVAFVVYVAAISFLSPQVVKVTSVADVRYLGPIVPLGVALAAGVIGFISMKKIWIALPLGVVVFAFSLIYGNWKTRPSTIYAYINELRAPPPEPYAPVSEWINQHVPVGGTVFVSPNYATYPLMFHAPRARYAWQLDNRNDPQFANLSPFLFKGEEMPDYLIGFGPFVNELGRQLQTYNHLNTRYQLVAVVDALWKDLYRPELFWRTFTPILNYPNEAKVFIFKRAPAISLIPGQ